MPIPIVRDGTTWYFDSARGHDEVINRRIGENELGAIAVCEGYVAAQKEYASRGHDGLAAGIYAQKLVSDEGKHNGLYWPQAPGKPDESDGAGGRGTLPRRDILPALRNRITATTTACSKSRALRPRVAPRATWSTGSCRVDLRCSLIRPTTASAAS